MTEPARWSAAWRRPNVNLALQISCVLLSCAKVTQFMLREQPYTISASAMRLAYLTDAAYLGVPTEDFPLARVHASLNFYSRIS